MNKKSKISKDKLLFNMIILGGILLIIDNSIFGYKILFKFSVFRLFIILIIYLGSLVIYTFKIKEFGVKQIIFTLYFIPYFLFFGSLFSLFSNFIIQSLKSNKLKYTILDIKFKYKGTLKSSGKIGFYLDGIQGYLPFKNTESIDKLTTINLTYYESIMGSRVIEEFNYY